MNFRIGSMWRKWDLHVHTPASILNNQFGDNWDNYIYNLFKKAIDEKICVIGITDYFSIDGYKKVLSYLNNDSKLNELFKSEIAVNSKYIELIKNILIVPNIELRIDKTVEVYPERRNSKIQLHVIFSNKLKLFCISELFFENFIANNNIVKTNVFSLVNGPKKAKKLLKEEGIEFENTEIGVVLTGSEECGLRGSKAWCEAHKGEFDDVPTFIYAYDTIYDPKYLMVNYRDLNGTVKADKDVSDLFMEATQELGIHCTKGMVPPLGGATDSAAFAQAGMRATGITGLNHKLESYYHTRRDTYDNMNEKGLADCYAASVKVLEMFDAGAKQ